MKIGRIEDVTRIPIKSKRLGLIQSVLVEECFDTYNIQRVDQLFLVKDR